MKNPLYSNETGVWEGTCLAQQLEAIRKHLCTGPCGQSSQVMQQRSRIDRALREAMKGIAEAVQRHEEVRR